MLFQLRPAQVAHAIDLCQQDALYNCVAESRSGHACAKCAVQLTQATPHHEDVAWVSRLAAAVRHRHRAAQVVDLQRCFGLSVELNHDVSQQADAGPCAYRLVASRTAQKSAQV